MCSVSYFSVWRCRLFCGRKIRPQVIKQFRFAGQCTFLRETIQCLPQQGRRPLTVINFIGLPFRSSGDLRFGFGDGVIAQVLENYSAAAFQCPSAIASVRDEMFQCAEQKRTEPPFLPIGVCICAALDQMSEKALGKVLRILRPISSLAQESVQWTPINSAQLRQRTECLSGSRRRITRFEHHSPTGRSK